MGPQLDNVNVLCIGVPLWITWISEEMAVRSSRELDRAAFSSSSIKKLAQSFTVPRTVKSVWEGLKNVNALG